ncbi:MAG: thymidylate kinase [Candidatus Sulfotelmatobacter sp.]|jgi:thymidylate kinase
MNLESPGDRRASLVSFSGIDGAGKSTQIENLRVRLNEAGARVLLITFWDDVAKLTRIREVSGHTLFNGESGVGTPARPVNRRDKNVQSWYMTAVRFGLYLVDTVSLRIVIARTLRADADVIIFDRYLYDELANLSLQNPISRAYVRLLLRFVPRPDISFLLDADPVQARARKPEYPLDFLHSSRVSYLALSELIGGMIVIAPQAVHDVERQVLQPVLNALSPHGLPSSPTFAHTAPTPSK